MRFTTPKRVRLAAFADQQTVLDLEGLFEAVAGMRRHLIQSHAANYTVLPEESGTLFIATAADVVFSLPPTEEGLEYTFVFKVPSAGGGGKISPDANDKIMGTAGTVAFTSANDKDAINTGATDREGDSMTLVADGLDGWFIETSTGVWARQV